VAARLPSLCRKATPPAAVEGWTLKSRQSGWRKIADGLKKPTCAKNVCGRPWRFGKDFDAVSGLMTLPDVGKDVPAGVTTTRRLRILATSDLHSHVHPYDYHADQPCNRKGLARTASLIDRLRPGADVCLLLDNGDFLSGCPLGDVTTPALRARPHPMVAAMNLLAYDAATLGNHEFNNGLAFLHAALDAARFPVISANTLRLDDEGHGQTLLPPYAVLERYLPHPCDPARPLRIGVIGFLPPQTAIWDRHLLSGLIDTTDIVEAARFWLPRLRGEGVDVVVALSHSGFGSPHHLAGQEDASTVLAGLDGIDAVIAGHAHQVFPSRAFDGLPCIDAAGGTVAGKPAVMPGAYGSHVGVIDLTLEPTATGWRVAGGRAAVQAISERGTDGMPVARVACRTDLTTATEKDHADTVLRMRQVIGGTPIALTSDFAMVADVVAQRMIAAAQADHVARALCGREEATLPILSAVAPFKTGGRGGPEHFTRIPAGMLASRHVADLYAFPNEIRAVRVSGAVLAEWLERSAAAYRQVVPGDLAQSLMDPAFPGYNFDMIAGLEYRIDPSQPARYDARGRLVDPAARRVLDLRRGGQPLDPEAEFIVATNNYRMATWDVLTGAQAEQVDIGRPAGVQAVLAAWFAAGRNLTVDTAPGWFLSLPPETGALLETSPRADPADLVGCGLQCRHMGRTTDGFASMLLMAPMS
jgi:2',3'-cyclic-nucleotide 2'-phosphodiesterase / 3'-nucleotidase